MPTPSRPAPRAPSPGPSARENQGDPTPPADEARPSFYPARVAVAVLRRAAQRVHEVTGRAWHAHAGASGGRAGPIPDAAALADIRRRAETSLADGVLAFWARAVWDQQHGGIITFLDRSGQRLGPSDKHLVAHARLLWTLSAAHRHGLTDRGFLALAERIAQYLIDRFWDPGPGGFLWTLGRDGQPLDSAKRTYGQAFAIFGLAEYARASGSQAALDWAVRTLGVLEDRAGDGDRGFREQCNRDWTPIAGPAGTVKTVNVHLHVMEALTTLYQARPDPALGTRLRAVTDLLLARGVDPRDRYAIDDLLDPDWRRPGTWRRPVLVSYGHGVELAWLAHRAVDVLGDPPARVERVALALIDHALAYGFDHRRGGLASFGPPAGDVRAAVYLHPRVRIKRWWDQAELLVATLHAYRWTGEARYLVAFARQFDWVWRHQTDHGAGDWFEFTAWRSGRPLGFTKGHQWKDPYHNGRALMEVARDLATDGTRSVYPGGYHGELRPTP